jgi:hypothetical protein
MLGFRGDFSPPVVEEVGGGASGGWWCGGWWCNGATRRRGRCLDCGWPTGSARGGGGHCARSRQGREGRRPSREERAGTQRSTAGRRRSIADALREEHEIGEPQGV